MVEQNKMEKIVTPMTEHICDHLCRFPWEIERKEDLEEVCAGCQIGEYICNILNTYNRASNFEVEILQGQAAHENMVADWKWHLTERFRRVV